MPGKKTSLFEKLKTPIGVGSGLITLMGLAFGVGYWKCSIDRRLDAMEETQRHNEEIACLKIEHNRQLIETKAELNSKILLLETEIQYLKAKNYEK